MARIYGIDVSSDNGKIDWGKVKAAGIKFAILRCHQRFGTEKMFESYYDGCVKNSIPVGAYKYCYAATAAEAKTEAKNVVKALKGKKIDYPVFYDLEDGNEEFPKLTDALKNKIVDVFCSKVENSGYKTAIYCNHDWYKNVITQEMKDKYDFWVASYPFEDNGTVLERLNPGIGIGWQYSEKGRVDGIEGDVCMDVFFTADADASDAAGGVTAQQMLDIARGWLGANQADGSHRKIVDLYNGHFPLAQGYRVSYTDSWCDTFVSACFIQAGATDLIGGTECGVERHVQLFKAAGIWIEDGTVTPQPGDIIVFNWDQSRQPNDGFSDHIGLVEAVGSGMIGTIEGNSSGQVRRRQYDIGSGNIRGFARPRYAAQAATPPSTDIEAIAREVIAGRWGNGRDRLDRLIAAGYDYLAVQTMVNKILSEEG